MLRTELFEIIKNGENSGIEFKRDDIRPEQLAKEVVALANLRGGYILLGVEDDGSILGIARVDIEEWVINVCRDKIRPEIIPYFELHRDVEPGKHIAVVSVEMGYAVHHLWHNNHRTYFIRVGRQSRDASPEELERLFQQRGSLRVEIRGVSGSSIHDLDRRRLKDYFERILQQDTPDIQDEDKWIQLLLNMEFLAEENGKIPATVAGLLLFGMNPNKFIPQSGIDAVAYPGIDKDYAARERRTLRGPMVPLSGDSGIIDSGLVEQAIQFVRRNTQVTAELEDGARRVEKWTYPEEAVKESIVNALVHRDYLFSSTDIELSIYDNRLEVISPGRLPNGITPERMKVGCRAARNQLLKDVMRDYRYLEHSGMGVSRKIVKGMKDHNGTEPDLIEDGEQFIIRLWK